MTCRCGHDRNDHDLWGSGPCCSCDCKAFASRESPRAQGKVARMAGQIQRAIAAGRRVLVLTPSGSVSGEQWLADRGLRP